MAKLRVSVEVEVALDVPEPGRAFAAILETVAQEIGASADPLSSKGAVSATDGRVAWRVTAIEEAALTTCVSCGRRVARADTDIREDGEVCRRCALGAEVVAHTEAAVDNAVVTTAMLLEGPLEGYLEGKLLNALRKRR